MRQIAKRRTDNDLTTRLPFHRRAKEVIFNHFCIRMRASITQRVRFLLAGDHLPRTPDDHSAPVL